MNQWIINKRRTLNSTTMTKGAFWRTRSVQQEKWVWQNASLLGLPITDLVIDSLKRWRTRFFFC